MHTSGLVDGERLTKASLPVQSLNLRAVVKSEAKDSVKKEQHKAKACKPSGCGVSP
jgi:hypothetical protein